MNDMSINQEAVPALPRMASVAVQVAIPLARLVASAANVRKTGAAEGIGELAASIAAHGLRQNLNVRPTDTERFEVVAGGRRLRALRMLVKQKRLPKDVAVPCIVMEDEEDAAEVSLVENTLRTAMHPDDQFVAFSALVEGGMPVEDVAARFGCAPGLVERRLRLAKVSPKLRGVFRKGEQTLDHIMAFTVTDDHAEQERVWKELPDWRRDPDDVRAALTREAVRFDTPVARFVGVEAYVAAGGTVMRDLFDEGCEGYAQDRVLLLALAGDKLQALAETVQAEGWKWVKAEAERDYSVSYRRVFAEAEGEGGAEVFAVDDMAKSGAIVRIGRDGSPQIERGLIHPDDIRREATPDPDAEGATKADKTALPASLVEDLTAHRTAALRLKLARNTAVALAATVHALAGPLLYGSGRCVSALEVRVSSAVLESRVAVPEDCTAHAGMQQEAQRWHAQVPEVENLFFGWCLAQPQEVLLDLLAFAAGSTVNAVRSRQERPDSLRLSHADAVAMAVGLDMAAHWQPSISGFYGRLSKAQLLATVTEAKAPMAVSIGTVRKAEAARYVSEAMVSTKWLPTPLRVPEPAAEQASEAA